MLRKCLTFDILYLSFGKECSCYCTKRHTSNAKVTKQGDFLRTVCYHISTHTRRGSHVVFILTGGSYVSPHWWELTLTSWRDWLMNNGYERGGMRGGDEQTGMQTGNSHSGEGVWNAGPCQSSLYLIWEKCFSQFSPPFHTFSTFS